MVKRFLAMLTLVSLLSISLEAKEVRVKGKVTATGKGLPNVMVTDGYHTTLTNGRGEYAMDCHPKAKFVYVSSPSGYDVPFDGSIPRFYIPIDSVQKRSASFVLTQNLKGDAAHKMVIWADPQIKRATDIEQLQVAAADLKEVVDGDTQSAYYALGCGDIVFDNLKLFADHNDAVAKVNIPFYQTVGNHDMDYNNRSNDGSKVSFEKVYGPAYYSFNKGRIHYVVLDNVFYIGRGVHYIGYLPEEQLAWLQKDLEYVAKGSTVVVALHIPTALDEGDLAKFSKDNISASQANKEALYQLLAPYKVHIVSGHMHTTHNVNIRSNIFEHNHSSVCGSWWYAPVAQDGTPKGYGILEAKGDSLQWYFKSEGFDRGHQLRMYALGRNSEQPEYVTANVWNWDWGWKVFWYEDGVRMGEMERYTGMDPYTLESYGSSAKPMPKWFGPLTTDHLFRVKPHSPSAKITVEAVDRFGNSYWGE